MQNFPIIVTTADGTLQGWLGGSLPNTTFDVQVFASADYSPGGAGQAEDYLGSLEITTDSAGQAIFNVPFSPPANMPYLTATATDPQGNTSEVSAQRQSTLEAPTTEVRGLAGQSTPFSATWADGIAINDPEAGPLDPSWTLTVSVAIGTLQLSTTVGLTGEGDGTGSLTYSGPLSDLNAVLAGMTFTPPPGFEGNTTLNVTAQSVGAAPAAAQVTITSGIFSVTNTNDAGPGSLR